MHNLINRVGQNWISRWLALPSVLRRRGEMTSRETPCVRSTAFVSNGHKSDHLLGIVWQRHGEVTADVIAPAAQTSFTAISYGGEASPTNKVL